MSKSLSYLVCVLIASSLALREISFVIYSNGTFFFQPLIPHISFCFCVILRMLIDNRAGRIFLYFAASLLSASVYFSIKYIEKVSSIAVDPAGIKQEFGGQFFMLDITFLISSVLILIYLMIGRIRKWQR